MKTVLFLLCIVASCSGQNQAPVFVKTMHGFSIPETQPLGSYLYTLSATDDGTVKYYTDADVFRVDADSGKVYLRRALDYEAEEIKLNVKFIAIDDENLEHIVQSTIIVLDANDTPPKFRRERYKQDIPEDFTVNTNVISNLIVRDVDFTGQPIEVYCAPNATLNTSDSSRKNYPQKLESVMVLLDRTGNCKRGHCFVKLAPLDTAKSIRHAKSIAANYIPRHPEIGSRVQLV